MATCGLFGFMPAHFGFFKLLGVVVATHGTHVALRSMAHTGDTLHPHFGRSMTSHGLLPGKSKHFVC